MTASSNYDLPSSSHYPKVLFKKQSGSLILSSDRIHFQDTGSNVAFQTDWKTVVKHQVSPTSFPKALLKLILIDSGGNNRNVTFQMVDREELERIRKDITQRLHEAKKSATSNKRPFSAIAPDTTGYPHVSFGDLDHTALAVTRSAILASNPALRQQHHFLVEESKTVDEQDFWETHRHLIEEEYAKISGMVKAGTSSLLQSHVPSSGRVTLGVEEMRQIFILYPAVHKAYEEKVPLELSDEQFWRKYLESEFFHRDRGRMGTAARNHAAEGSSTNIMSPADKNKKRTGPSEEEQDARAAVVGTDDLFSRYDQKLQESASDSANENTTRRRWGKRLAVGQFDLATTFETERGELLEGPKDNHPPNQFDDGKGARVIQKYNRHWAMVLHPDEAVAGANLMEVARKSVDEVLPNDPEADPAGGVDDEMRRLVEFANAAEEEANHALGLSMDDQNYEPLTLANVEAYYSGSRTSLVAGDASNQQQLPSESEEDAARRHSIFARAMAAKAQALARSSRVARGEGSLASMLPEKCLPPSLLGKELLAALTKKMAQDSKTEAASVELVNQLPEDFRKKLQTYFRRSSELLRHFFGLRRLEAQDQAQEHRGSQPQTTTTTQKLARIVTGMETFYREMEQMRRGLPQSEMGERMRKMCLPIMDQLDWAFKLHREGRGGRGGGFVAVDEL